MQQLPSRPRLGKQGTTRSQTCDKKKTELTLQTFATFGSRDRSQHTLSQKCAETHKGQMAKVSIKDAKPEFQKARKSKDADTAWTIFANAAEKYLRSRCTSVPNCAPGERGRRRPPVLAQQTPTCRTADKLRPECIAAAALSKCYKHLRRARELRVKMLRLQGQTRVGQDDVDINNLSRKLLSYDVVFQVTRVPCDTASLDVVDNIIEALTRHAEELQSLQAVRRCNSWKHRVRESQFAGGKAVYA